MAIKVDQNEGIKKVYTERMNKLIREYLLIFKGKRVSTVAFD